MPHMAYMALARSMCAPLGAGAGYVHVLCGVPVPVALTARHAGQHAHSAGGRGHELRI